MGLVGWFDGYSGGYGLGYGEVWGLKGDERT